MKSEFLTTHSDELISRLRSEIAISERLFFICAFGSTSGFDLVRKEFDEFTKNSGSAHFLFDISQGMTDPKLIEELATYPGDVNVKICGQYGKTGFVHSKNYIFESTENCLIVGSNNFSSGGLKRNIESAIVLTDPAEDLFDKVEDFAFSLWHSKYAVNPLLHPEIFEKYKALHGRQLDERFVKSSAAELDDLFQSIEIANSEEKAEVHDFNLNYLLGMLAANISYQSLEEIKNGRLTLIFKSQTLNSLSESDSGYITNVVDGVRLGGIKFEQKKMMERSMISLSKNLKKYLATYDPGVRVELSNNTKVQISITLKIEFSQPNLVWKALEGYAMACLTKRGNLVPVLPKRVSNTSPDIGLYFFKGYADFRGRLSSADRVGTAGKLRIALQVDKLATKFLYESEKYLHNTQGLTVNVSDGSSRGKDNMLRITADSRAVELFQSGWKRRMASLFSEFNDTL